MYLIFENFDMFFFSLNYFTRVALSLAVPFSLLCLHLGLSAAADFLQFSFSAVRESGI